MTIPVFVPFPVFTDADGDPLESGYLYFGVAGQNPETSPIVVYWDSAGTLPAAQPIRTMGGYAVRNGSPANIFVNANDFSLTVKDRQGRFVFNSPNSAALNLVTGSFSGSGGSANIGFIQAGTGAVLRTVQSKLRDIIHVKDFGAVGDGTTDDTDAIEAAIASLAANGGTIMFDALTYRVTRTINIGDGSISQRSTKCGVRLIGAAGGVGAGEFGTPNSGCRVLWDGATSTTTPVIKFNGPIHSCSMERFVVDAANKAGRGIELQHPYQCIFIDVQVERYTTRGWMAVSLQLPSVAALLALGVTQGCMDNTFINCHSRDPSSTAAESGLYLDGYDAGNIGCSRNLFSNCVFLIGGAANTQGIYLGFVDNCTFTRVTTAWSAGSTSGRGVYQQGSTTNPGFPVENVFNGGCSIIGGIVNSGSGTIGNNMYLPYHLSDGQPLPTYDGKTKALLPDGRMLGGFAGSAVPLMGRADPATGLNTTGIRYYPISGSGPNTVAFPLNQVSLMPCGGRIVLLRSYLAAPPGAGSDLAIRVMKNGVATNLETFYSATADGDKIDLEPLGVPFVGGDRIEIRATVNGTMSAAHQCSWTIYAYFEEVF